MSLKGDHKKTDLAVPWKWMSNHWEEWYFVKKTKSSNLWTEYVNECEGKVCGQFKQTATSIDANGDLEVYLSRTDRNDSLKLSQGILCRLDANNTCNEYITEGFWVKSDGIIFANIFDCF